MKRIEIIEGVVVDGQAAQPGQQFDVGRGLTARQARSLVRRGLAREAGEPKGSKTAARREGAE
jgi:hypothetical protein